MPQASAPLLDFKQARTVKGHSLNLPERLRAARGVPQAIVKVASFAQGRSEVLGQVNYISRKGKLELETESGEILTSKVEAQAMVDRWSRDFGHRKRSRDAVHLVFSMPRGSDPEALRSSVRKVLQREFEGHEWAFTVHQDKSHPHAHVVMKMWNREKRKRPRLRKEDLHHLREVFAEAAREEGVELAASPRSARGIGRKGMKQAAYHMRQRKAVPKAEKQTAQETVFELQKGRLEEKPWEQAMKKRNDSEREAYQAEADRLKLLAQQSEKDRAMLLRAAADLERYSEEMPKPKTLRQMILELLNGPTPSKPLGRKETGKDQKDLDR